MKKIPPSEQLLAFKLVAELGSFSAAAHTLNITQSAVSHQIARLENRLGFRLIARTSQRLALTDVGERYYAAISQPIASLMEALANLGDPIGLRRLSIQVESGLAGAWLTPRLQKFLALYPGLQVEQRRASAINFSDGMELAIKWGKGTWPHYDAKRLIQVNYTPVCSPRLLSGSNAIKNVEDLRHHTLLHDRQYREWQKWFELAGIKNIDAKRGHVVDDTNLLLDMAMAGQGVALSSPLLTQRPIHSGDLVMLFPDIELRTDEAYYLVTRKGKKLSQYAQAFITWLEHELDDQSVPNEEPD